MVVVRVVVRVAAALLEAPAQDPEADGHHEHARSERQPRIELLGHDELREPQRHEAEAEDACRVRDRHRPAEEERVTRPAAGSDEVPGVYKDIRQVMAAQEDLVEIVGQFDPKIVRMCGDGSRAED